MRSALPSAAVVIPTYDRLDTLRGVVAAVEREIDAVTAAVELVVVDDGSGDGTWAWLLERARRRAGMKVLRQDNAGPARARNRGAAAAEGEIALFLGDDTEPAPGWLLHHLEEHRLFGGAGPLAVVGYTSFPAAGSTPFGRFINEYGAQFGYLLIEHPVDVPFNFFYTSNISLPRALLLEDGGFREDFPAAAWEDIEFAYRAVARGLRLRYLPRARTVHRHRIRPGTFCRRQRTAGRSGAIFAQLHPELAGFLGAHLARPPSRGRRLHGMLLRLWVALGEALPGVASAGVMRRMLDQPYHEGLAEGLHRLQGGGG